MAGLHPGQSSQLGLHEENHEDDGRWYFSRKEIEDNSPSRHDGIDLKKETYYRKSYCTFLQDLGMRLKVPQVTIATAIIFCHRYYLRQSHAKSDRRTVATACMFLAGKVEETPRPLKDVILVSYEIIHKKDPEAVQRIKQKEVYEQQKELIAMAERVVLGTLGYDLNVQHPYKPLVEAIKKFRVAQNALAQVAWNFVNDGLRTSLCLQFKPHHIAAGAIFLAAKFLKVRLPSDGEKVWWQEFDVTPRQLEEVSNQMLELYEQNRVPPSQGSEVESVAGGATKRAASTLSTEDNLASNSHTQDGGGAWPETSKAMSANLMSDPGDNHGVPPISNQNRGSDYGSEVMKGSEQRESGESRGPEPPSRYIDVADDPYSSSQYGGKDNKVGYDSDETDPRGESKYRLQNRNVEQKGSATSNLPLETIKKFDEDKLKELREKRKKSRGEVIRRNDPMDEYDPIVKELEEGVELAAAERDKIKHEKKQAWSLPSSNLDDENPRHGKNWLDFENVEEGEVSARVDPSWVHPKKRKLESPLENGKVWHASVPGSSHLDHTDWSHKAGS
ncbi:hypothetical protein Droror1_Dr00004571 [Drosera rotundifolia]